VIVCAQGNSHTSRQIMMKLSMLLLLLVDDVLCRPSGTKCKQNVLL